MDKTVLIYIEDNNKFLLIHKNKKHDINYDKWMGIGGHIEDNETVDQACIREAKEETGLNIFNLEKIADIYFINPTYKEIMYLYKTSSFTGNLIKECDEGELRWVEKDKILDLPSWQGDKFFIEPMLKNEKNFVLTLEYDLDGNLIKCSKSN